MKHKNFVVIGGDKRQIALSEYLRGEGFGAVNFGLYDWDNGKKPLKSIITKTCFVVLPLPVSKNGETVFMPFSETELTLNSLLGLLGTGNTVFGGMIPKWFKKELERRGIPYFDYYDAEFTAENAYLTAICTLKIILEHIDFALPCGKFAVMGYGRVGRETADILKKLSCDVTVFARSENALKNAALRGCGTAKIEDFPQNSSKFDIIINTVPCNIIGCEALENIKKDGKIIELASAPFGVDFKNAEKYSVSVIKAAGLPGKYTAKTAGELIGSKIVQSILKEE